VPFQLYPFTMPARTLISNDAPLNDDDLTESSMSVSRCIHLTACDSFVPLEDFGIFRLGIPSQ